MARKFYPSFWWNWYIPEEKLTVQNIEENFVSLAYLQNEYMEYFADDCTFDEYLDEALHGMGGLLYDLADIYVHFDELRQTCGNFVKYNYYTLILRAIAEKIWR